MRLLCAWMCRAHCHRIIKLSGTLDKFAPEKELVENVHGCRKSFLDYGVQLSKVLKSPQGKDDKVFGPNADPKVYFIGKMLYSKGLNYLMELLKYAEESAGLTIDMDMYGGGPDFEDAQLRSQNLGLSMTFHGPIDHAALAPSHKVSKMKKTTTKCLGTSFENSFASLCVFYLFVLTSLRIHFFF
jgi:digalactosyldiacylglycerol synthase